MLKTFCCYKYLLQNVFPKCILNVCLKQNHIVCCNLQFFTFQHMPIFPKEEKKNKNINNKGKGN